MIENKIKSKPLKNFLISDTSIWWKDRNTLIMLALMLIITFVTLMPVLNASFIFWDDNVNIFDNIRIKSLSLHNIGTIFSSESGSNYNPLTVLTYAIEHHFFKLNPFYYHLDNLLLHLINTILVFWFMMLIGLNRYWACLIALLFGIHPMHVESVAWATERKDVLFGMFYLAAIINYIQYQKIKLKKYLILVYVFFLLSLISKIQAVSLPLSLLTIDYLLKRPLKIKIIIEKIPYFLLSILTGIIGLFFLKSYKILNNIDYTFTERIMVGCKALFHYILKAIVPYQLKIAYILPTPGKFEVYYYFIPFILIIIGYLVYLSAKHTRAIVFGMLFFLVNIIFLLQMVPAGNAYQAERFSYISYIGLIYMIVYGIKYLFDNWSPLRIYIFSSIASIILVCSFMSYSRAQKWENTITLFTDLIEKDPDTPFGYKARADYYIDKEMYEQAIDNLTKHIKIRIDDNQYALRGSLYYKLEDYKNAFADFNIAIKLDPRDLESYQNRGLIFIKMGQYQLALNDFNKALGINPNLDKTIGNRAMLYNILKQYDKSLKDCNTYLTLHPDNGLYYNLRALTEVELKQFDAALKDYDLALKYGFDKDQINKNRSVLYSKMGSK